LSDRPGSSGRLGAPLVIGTPVVEFEPRPQRTRGYRPDLAADGWSTEHFAVRAASVRGYQHRHDGTPRQDDFALAWHAGAGAVIVAVADGVSGAELGHLGATLACRTAVEQVSRLLDADPRPQPDWREVLRCAAWALVEHAGQQAGAGDAPAEWAERWLATTLVLALVLPGPDGTALVSAARVGDSAAWVLREGSGWAGVFDVSPGDAAAAGAAVVSAAVTALPRLPAEVAGVTVELPAGAVLLVGTDGVGTALGSGAGPVGDALAASLAGRPSPLEFAHLLDFSRETFDDDRTLVAVWPVPPVPPAGPVDPTDADQRAAAELAAAGLTPEELAIAGLGAAEP
jgi:hypothetical protein